MQQVEAAAQPEVIPRREGSEARVDPGACFWADRLLGLLGREEAPLDRRLRSLALGLGSALLLEAVKNWARLGSSLLPALLCGMGLVLCWHRVSVLSISVLTGVAGWCCAATFPTTANHVVVLFVALLCATPASVSLARAPDARSVQLVRWLAFSILWGSGVQKLLHGTYWDAEFLAAKLASPEGRWRWLDFLVGEAELARLRSLDFRGPYQLSGWLPRLASRSIPLLEVGLGFALFHRSVRFSAATAATVFLIALQCIAGEIVFAMTMVAVLGVFHTERTALRLATGTLLAAGALGLVLTRFPTAFN